MLGGWFIAFLLSAPNPALGLVGLSISRKETSKMRITVDKFSDLCFRIFKNHGFTDDEASVCTEEIVEAHCRGRLSHGATLIPEVLEWKKEQSSPIEVVKDASFYAYIIGNNAMGPLIAKQAMDMAIDKADRHGIGIVGVNNKFPFILAGYNPRRAAIRGFIGINWSVAFSKVAPWGSADPIFGTNPIGIAIPTRESPFVLDMAITKIAAAEIRRAKKLGLTLPADVAISKEGYPTTDPVEALHGAMLTFGGYKGSGLAMAIELLGGPFVGAKAGKSVPGNRGMVFMAIKSDLFVEKDKFLKNVTELIREVKASRTREGFDEILIPGERGDRLLEKSRKEGVEIDDAIYEELIRLADNIQAIYKNE